MQELRVELESFLSNTNAELEAANQTRTPRILTRDGEPVAAVLSYDQYLAWRRAVDESKARALRALDELAAHNQHFSEEEIERDVREAIAEVRAEQRARSR